VNPFNDSAKLFMAAGLGFLFDGLTDMFTVFTVATAKASYEKLAGSEPVIELEPGHAETVPVEGNTAETPAMEAHEDGEIPDGAEEAPEGAEAGESAE